MSEAWILRVDLTEMELHRSIDLSAQISLQSQGAEKNLDLFMCFLEQKNMLNWYLQRQERLKLT